MNTAISRDTTLKVKKIHQGLGSCYLYQIFIELVDRIQFLALHLSQGLKYAKKDFTGVSSCGN